MAQPHDQSRRTESSADALSEPTLPVNDSDLVDRTLTVAAAMTPAPRTCSPVSVPHLSESGLGRVVSRIVENR